MFKLDAQRAAVVLQPVQFVFEELTLSAQLPALLLGARGNANGFELMGVAIEMTRASRTHSSRASSRSFLRRRSGESRMGVVTSECAPAATSA